MWICLLEVGFGDELLLWCGGVGVGGVLCEDYRPAGFIFHIESSKIYL